jgi:hypothetical protein
MRNNALARYEQSWLLMGQPICWQWPIQISIYSRVDAPAKMWSNNSFHNFWRPAVLTLFVCLCSCEGDPFDRDSKQIAHGYRLKRTGNPSRFALVAPYDTGGLIIDEIGWHKPFILFRASGSQYWDRIDTDHAEHIRISEVQRTSDPNYRSIPIENASTAWNHLERHKRIW